MGKLKRKVRRMWWDIKDIAFIGTNITRRNGMFMSTANSLPVGSILDMKKNLWGQFSDSDLVFSLETLSDRYPSYPEIIEDTAKPPTSFTLDRTNETGLEILASIVDSSKVANISAELSTIIKNAQKVIVNIDEWGIDYIEEGEVAVFLSKAANSDDPRIEQILDGDNYIATRGIWIKGMSFETTIDHEAIAKVKAIIESKKADLIKANVNLDIKTELTLDLAFDYEEKFYPFFKFRKIKFEKNEDYYLIASAELPDNDVVLDDVDFTEFTV
jgi:hypothetical protein